MKFASTSLLVVAFAAEAILSASASSSPLSGAALRHRGLAHKLKRAVGIDREKDNMSSRALEKRTTYSGTATWYGAGVSEGACGVYSTASDNIVALNINLYGDQNAESSWCGKSLEITHGSITKTATVVDCCASCHSDGDLDMSTGLFQEFGESLGAGEFSITWQIAGSSGGNDNKKDDSTTSTHHHTSTTHKTTSTHTTQHTSTVHSTVTTSSSSSASTLTSTSTLSAASATNTADSSTNTTTAAASTSTQGDVQNLSDLNDLISGLLNIANAGQA